ncbi:carbohydrate ABC transporter permease [Eisenbergiella tayi]|uniref:L-arabinose transport system permease protein AraQ n=1 Tax=Eisenbergiella tayi TaxID=1432052 RepID=A0A1E3AY18_9FIRM|nr:carbohydrate ABC transporter permease [Eisenbergiella tayi]ODM13593.1 L-arabinose transport system permease protein AraQ [Eisenbergiella tayi]
MEKATAITRKKMRKSKEDWILDIIIYTLAVVILFITVYPFYYVFMLSFNEGLDASLGGIYWLPRKFTLTNYSKFFTDWKWVRGLGVTVARTVIGTFLGVLFTTLVAYGISFKDLIGRKAYMTFIIICMYFSGGIIPYYTLLRGLHLIDTFWVYIVPGMLNLFYITIGRTFFEGIPDSLRESAKIDGASELRIFAKIIMPISKPFMATLALFIGVAHWNNWYDSTFFVKTKTLRTLPYLMMEIINQFQTNAADLNAAAHQSTGTTSLSVQMAAMVISVVPIIFIYPFLQKYFVTGMMVGAVKE